MSAGLSRSDVVKPSPEHRDDWERLYAGYAAFYQVEQTPEMRARVWGWIQDPDHEVEGLVALGADGRAVGLAHFRAFARPLAASTGGFLDDLFVAPEARGSGAAQALIEAVAAIGRERGWSVVRWITAEDNGRARAVYDRLAARTRWVTYDLKLG
jgi:GNAT superfamily N-acetyltransferase